MDITTVACRDLPDATWQVWPAEATSHDLAIFRASLSDAAGWFPQLEPLLSPDERERAARYCRRDDQLRFSCTRALLRLLLGRFTNKPAGQLTFGRGFARKPELLDSVGWYFNVSHSGDWLLITIGRSPVGVDLEWINPDFPFQDVSQISFSAREQQYITSCPEPCSCFYQLWTRKEALVKATGKGMDDLFDRIPSLPGDHSVESSVIGGSGCWQVISFGVADGYPAAIAHNGPARLVPTFYTLDLARLAGRE